MKYMAVPLSKKASTLSELMEWGKGGVVLAHALAALGATSIGYGLSRATAPSHISDNAEDEIVLNALDSNIVAARRKLEDRKAALAAEQIDKQKKTPYDMVLN